MTSTGERHIEHVDIDTIQPAERNAKKHNRAGIARSIRTGGFIDALVRDDRTERLIAGHGRLEALQWMRNNNEPAPTGITVDDTRWLAPVQTGWASTDDQHATAATVALNRWTELGGWDNTTLHELLADLADYATDDLLAVAGYSLEDLETLTKQIPATLDEFPEHDAPQQWRGSTHGATGALTCPECGHQWTP